MTNAPRKFELWVYADETSPTGLRWLPDQRWRKPHGVAGCINPRTLYASLVFKENGRDVQFMCHRIVYYLHTGVWPEINQINHINRNRSDNRFENLEFLDCDAKKRETIQKIDRANKGALPRYVSWNSRDKRYQGSIRDNGKRKSLGYSKCVNTLHKKAIDFVNSTYERRFEYSFVERCNFCLRCPHLLEGL